jgi:hypothetical protein
VLSESPLSKFSVVETVRQIVLAALTAARAALAYVVRRVQKAATHVRQYLVSGCLVKYNNNSDCVCGSGVMKRKHCAGQSVTLGRVSGKAQQLSSFKC